VRRLAATLLHVSVIAALATAGAADDTGRGPHEVRIPHADGSGRSTVVEIPSGVSGAERFVRSTPEPIPRPGELIVPTASPAAVPSPAPVRR
jgi:hypothetical protein